jgi:ketosteroid isomerase-like protein
MKRVQMGWLVLLLAFTTNLFSQNWNAQQKEAWANVEAYWALQAKGDLAGFLSYFSPDYTGWGYDSPVPQGKAAVEKYVSMGMKNNKMLLYDITPVSILVYGDIAIVHYYYNMQRENLEGKKSWESGRWTDILQRQGQGGTGKWVLISDHGGEVKNKE